jgi:hypothetical protein
MTSMRTNAVLASDTPASAERAQLELWRRMPPLEKLRLVTEITLAVETLALAGIRLRHPRASDRECFLRLATLKLGRPLACRVYPEAAGISDLWVSGIDPELSG